MYEAPDRYKRMISARLPDGESLGVTSREPDDGSSPLRDAQLIARGQFAPFFAAANSIAAVLMAMLLFGHVSASYLGGWVVAVGGINLVAMQLSRTQAITHVGRSGRKLPRLFMVGDILTRALLWLSLPVLSFSSLAPQSQLVAATLIAGLGIAALGLVVVPTCVTAWMAIFTAGLSYSLLVGRSTVPLDNLMAILFTLGVAIVGVLTVARWAFGQLKTNADFGSQSESASLLLQEYEQRGVGWLWQVDGENRVTYISSRMTALLGRPASALLGYSLPALLGGHAELGRVVASQTVQFGQVSGPPGVASTVGALGTAERWWFTDGRVVADATERVAIANLGPIDTQAIVQALIGSAGIVAPVSITVPSNGVVWVSVGNCDDGAKDCLRVPDNRGYELIVSDSQMPVDPSTSVSRNVSVPLGRGASPTPRS